MSKERNPINEQELDQKLYYYIHEVRKWVERDENEFEVYPTLDQMVDDDVFNEENGMKKYLFKKGSDTNLNPREYACIALAHQVYDCLGEIYTFISTHEDFIQILASESYNKVFHAFVEVTQSPILALLDPAINKFMKFSSGIDIDIECQIKWQYEGEKGVGLVWKESIPEWETEKEEEEEEEKEEDIPCKK